MTGGTEKFSEALRIVEHGMISRRKNQLVTKLLNTK